MSPLVLYVPVMQTYYMCHVRIQNLVIGKFVYVDHFCGMLYHNT